MLKNYLNHFKSVATLFLLTVFGTQVYAQTLPLSTCGPSGGIQADIIEVQTAYRGLNGVAPTFSVPIGAQNATVTISSHSSVLTGSSTQDRVNDEDFITVTAVLDFTTNTSSGILNFARSTYENESESNLYSWIDVPFGVNVSSQYAEGQITSPPLNDVTFSLASGVLTITETATDIQSSYLVEYTSPNTNSLTSTGAKGLFFTGGATDLSQSTSIPANTDVIIISKKGTVRVNNGSYTNGWEEGYADGRIVIDLDNSRMDGFLTVANGADLVSRSTYVIENHGLNSTGFLTASGNVSGDYTGKTTADATPASVGISDPAIYISGGNLHIDRQVGYATAFDDVYLFEFYERTGDPMSASFIASRSSYIARTEGTASGTDRVIKIPTGSDYAIVRQAGNANNTNEHANENPMAGYYYIDLRAEKALGYYWQQVGFDGVSTRRDDNYGFAAVPLDGQSTRLDATNGSISNGIYYTTNPYDLSFNLSADKSELTITNAFGLVANEYKALSLVTFYGKKIDLTATTNTGTNVYDVINNGSCGGVEVTFTVCNPGSGNSAGGFHTAVYDKNPTTDGTAKLLYVGTFPTPIAQGDCEKNIFDLDLNALGIDDINGAIYCVLNDDGRNAAGGLGTAIGQPFSLTDLEGQNEDYIECDYSNNLIPITVAHVMECPTVDFLVTNNTKPTLTGTWDETNATTSTGLEVTVDGVTYVLGTDNELSVVGDDWTLDLSGLATALNVTTYPVEAKSINGNGSVIDGTTDELLITSGGLVMLDINGISDNSLSGPAQDTVNNQQLYVNIVHEGPFGSVNEVVETSPVTNGTYVVTSTSFMNTHEYSFQLSTLQGTVGSAPPAIQLSGDFVYTAEGESGAGDGTPDGYYFTTIADANDLPAVSFGIQRKPKSGGNDIPGVVVGNVVQGTRYNPGTFGGFEMPAAAFGGTDDGNIDAVTITSISSTNNNILFLTYDGVDYYRNASDNPGCGTCADFPVGGITIPTTTSGVLTKPVYLATVATFIDGSLFIDYTVTDNAGFDSDNTTTLEVPMIALKYESGAWANGSDGSGQPDQTDGDKTLFWIDNGGTLSVNAEVKNVIIYNGVDAEVEGVCLKVNNEVDNQGGKLVLTALSDLEYGQYYGPTVLAKTEMQFENGWHNVAFPVDITVADLQAQNNLGAETNKISVTGDIKNSNLMWYDTYTSGGKEYGFFVNRNGNSYAAHAYGQYIPSATADNLIDRGWNFYWDDKFVISNPDTLKAEGMTNDASHTYTTHNNFGGWTLIPNIYPVALSTRAMYDDGFFNGDIDKAVFIWNPNDAYVEPIPGNTNTGAYIGFDPENGVSINGALSPTTDGDALIAPYQGFYILRSDASTARRIDVDGTNVHGLATNPAVTVGTTTDDALPSAALSIDVTMKPEYRSNCEITTNYKTGPAADVVLLQVTDKTAGFTDATELAFASHYTDQIDKSFDIRRFAGGGASYPMLFSIIENEALVINKMAIPDFTKTVPLGFASAQANNEFTIEANHNPAEYTLYLEDLKTGAWHNLNTGEYSFKNDINFSINRFMLHFNSGKREIVNGAKVIAFPSGSDIQVVFEQITSPTADVMITNTIGQIVYQKSNVSTSEILTVTGLENNVPTMYVIRVSAGAFNESVKMIK